MDRFSHNRYAFTRQDANWCIDSSWRYSDLCREMVHLIEAGIPAEAMQIVHKEYDRRGYERLIIDFSADEQITALAERQHQAWLVIQAIEAEQYRKQYEKAVANQQAQAINWDEWTI